MHDFQPTMVAVVQNQINSNMLFFQVNPVPVAVNPLRGHSQENRSGPSWPARQELSKRPAKERQPKVSEQRRKKD